MPAAAAAWGSHGATSAASVLRAQLKGSATDAVAPAAVKALPVVDHAKVSGHVLSIFGDRCIAGLSEHSSDATLHFVVPTVCPAAA